MYLFGLVFGNEPRILDHNSAFVRPPSAFAPGAYEYEVHVKDILYMVWTRI
jgi:hypothetical protein